VKFLTLYLITNFMKKVAPLFALLLMVIFIFSGCASYNAVPLSTLYSEMFQTSDSQNEKTVLIIAKTFNKSDCKKYLDRNVIGLGYQPIQLYIQNNSDKSYVFSLNRISMTCVRPEEVGEKSHTSTVGRSVGYGAAAWFTCGIFVIPAIVDGIKSSQANEALDNDFLSKSARDQIIFPHSHFNKLIFIPASEYQQTFTITLIDEETNQPKLFTIRTL
jgi:hypothetical protein